MLVNKVNRLIKKDNELKPTSKSQHYALTRNRFAKNLLNRSLKKIETDFDKTATQLKNSISCTVQSFELIKEKNQDSTGNAVRIIQNSRDSETNYQSLLEKFHKDRLEIPPLKPDDLKAFKVSVRTKKYRKKYSKMKPILNEKEMEKTKLEKDNANLGEWRKFKEKQYQQGSDINLSKFRFSDRNLYEAYMDALDERDAYVTIKSLSTMKKNDLFSDDLYFKQYRALMKAKVTNTTPVFENDSAKPVYSKPLIVKLKQDLVKNFNAKSLAATSDDDVDNNNNYNYNKNNQLNEKVKQFLKKY